MTVNKEIKSNLAKLLAMENIVVEHRNVETASFDVENRVLTLPMWKYASEDVYDMLVGHEVGHALYTPNINWIADRKIPPQFVNIVEDVRIEKKIKQRYVGIVKNFNRAYKELNDRDFFQIAEEDLEEMNLADRANLFFKIGDYVNIPIEEGEEMEIINMISECVSFDDVLDASEKLYTYCKYEHSEKEDISVDTNLLSDLGNSVPGDVESESCDSQEQEDSDNYQVQQSDLKQQPAQSEKSSTQEEDSSNEPEVKTMDSFDEALKQLICSIGTENVYLEIPDIDVEKIIIPNSEIHKNCDHQWSFDEDDGEYVKTRIKANLETMDLEYEKFKSSAKREVSYLIKEFECRKSADAYARASVSRTGVLDCSKLHTYKYNEDLFKKVTTFSDGKNHGLVFVLDWSGSMGRVMLDTIKQLYNLIWFCKRSSIPFEVYAFTCEYPIYDDDGMRDRAYEEKHGLLEIHQCFSLMNIFTHKVSSKTLDHQMKNIWRIATTFSTYTEVPVPLGMALSGTPLNETIMVLNKILPKFRKENKLQKVQCIILTDGESQGLRYHVNIHDYAKMGEITLGRRAVKNSCIVRDRKTGKTYSLDVDWNKQVDVFLRYIRDNQPDVNFIGFRLLEPRDAGSFIRSYCGYYGDVHDKTVSDWRKNKSFTLSCSGYHKYFGISANAVSDKTEFIVPEDATKSQIKTAFMKSLNSKKTNKKILREFVELIA